MSDWDGSPEGKGMFLPPAPHWPSASVPFEPLQQRLVSKVPLPALRVYSLSAPASPVSLAFPGMYRAPVTKLRKDLGRKDGVS